MPAVQNALVRTVQSVIQGLELQYTPAGKAPTDLPSSQVYGRKIVTDRDTATPFIMAGLGGKEELDNRMGGTEQLEIIYPVLVVHAFASNQDYDLDDDEDAWRLAIITAFVGQPRPEVTGGSVWNCQIDPNPPVDLSAWSSKNLSVGALLLRFWVRFQLSTN